MSNPRILVVEGNSAATREATVAAGGRETADTYIDALRASLAGVDCEVVRPTDGDTVAAGRCGAGGL